MTQVQTLAAEIERVTALRAEWASLGGRLDSAQQGSGYRVTINVSNSLKAIDKDLERARLALRTGDAVQRAVEIGTLRLWK